MTLATLDLRNLEPRALDAAARRYDEHGFLLLEGAAGRVLPPFRAAFQRALGVSAQDFERLLDPEAPPLRLGLEQRRAVSRMETPPEMARELLAALEPLLLRLIGPLVHVSSTFHGQFKSGEAPPVDHGGYAEEYLEVQGQYLLHQDFAGASIPTSPSALTLWVPLNSCPDWNLRLYPGSHRRGLLCNEWIGNDDPRLVPLGGPLDVQARAGTAVVFNALMLHSSANPGRRRRLSCDLRFFPLCSFLPSEIHALGRTPLRALRERLLARAEGPTLRAPLLEACAFLGLAVDASGAERHSALHWAAYVGALLNGEGDAALVHLERLVNREIGIDGALVYAAKFHDRPRHREPLERLRRRLAALEPGAGELAALDRLLAATPQRA